MPPTRITVLVSGNGSNLQAIIDACQNRTIPNAAVVRVISNRKQAYGLERAENACIPTAYHNLLKYKKLYSGDPEGDKEAREAYFQDLASIVLEDKPNLVVLAGWMLIVTSSFLERLAKIDCAVINLHPALPGEFDGINAIDQAYKAFREGRITRTGCMIHYVIREVDQGAPIVTKELALHEGETLDQVEARMHKLEWQAIVEGTKIAIDTLVQARSGAVDT